VRTRRVGRHLAGIARFACAAALVTWVAVQPHGSHSPRAIVLTTDSEDAGPLKLSLSDGSDGSAYVPLVVRDMRPGNTYSQWLRLKGPQGQPWRLSAALENVQDKENGCVGPERAVDTTCGADQGELSGVLHYALTASVVDHGAACPVSSPPPAAVDDVVSRWRATAWTIRDHAEVCVHASVTLPATAGVVVESDGVLFAVEFTGQGL
jgi:hypothetical protein